MSDGAIFLISLTLLLSSCINMRQTYDIIELQREVKELKQEVYKNEIR